MKILCIGRTGQVAHSLRERSEAMGVSLVALGRPDLDLANRESLRDVIDQHDPTIIVNAAAYTAVDQAETDRAAAYEINAEAVKALAQIAHDRGNVLIHISTDYVFDGSQSEPYSETDPVNPLGVYGASKFAGEEAVRNMTPFHIILRTAWVYSPFGKNFVKTMLRLAEDRDSVSIVSDQWGNPTSAIDIADGILEVCSKVSEMGDAVPFGTYHMAGAGFATWADLAEFVFKTRAQSGFQSVKVARIASSEYPTPVKRPENSVLNCAKLDSKFGVTLPDWRSSTKTVVNRLLSEGASK